MVGKYGAWEGRVCKKRLNCILEVTALPAHVKPGTEMKQPHDKIESVSL